ncbi:MAG: deoxyribodipyrimidine photo-lyase [Candidatus Cloacimonadaceae bacterium]|nr:deoxyribodipyrimidine photo-lyase [Candidatus Cloacimonadota bacterium]
MKQRIIRSRVSPSEEGSYVLYWMQQAQRLEYNFALDYAASEAQSRQLPLVIVFVITASVSEAQPQHYRFMLEGIREIAASLKARHNRLYVYAGDPVKIITALSQAASVLVMDHGYLKWQRLWRDQIFDNLESSSIVELDTEAVVPVHVVSDKEEYSASTLRSKILKLLPEYLDFEPEISGIGSKPCQLAELDVVPCPDPTNILELENFGRTVFKAEAGKARASFEGGYQIALDKLHEFENHKLGHYAQYHNHPDLEIQSDLSPYLHFGQISPLKIIDAIRKAEDGFGLRAILADRKNLSGDMMNLAEFLEELIVRRELSFNFCSYNPDYDNFAGLPAWARSTLLNHIQDSRERGYTLEELENAASNDVFWNAAQTQMLKTGKMHNYMRMYWGKRVLSWFNDVEEAYAVLLHLNNKYELDGRGPNAFAGVAWCFGKHDRPWVERPIYGMVRFMNANGLKRKFDMQAYLRKVFTGELE